MHREPPAQAAARASQSGRRDTSQLAWGARNGGLRMDLPCGREARFVFNSANPLPPPPGPW